jgi:hypothetical protein
MQKPVRPLSMPAIWGGTRIDPQLRIRDQALVRLGWMAPKAACGGNLVARLDKRALSLDGTGRALRPTVGTKLLRYLVDVTVVLRAPRMDE